MKSFIRQLARKCFLTSNTIRYLLEWPRLREASGKAGGLGTLVDGGAGSGEFARRFLADGICSKVIALEPFQANYDILRQNAGRYGDRFEVIQSGIETIPLESDSADCVLCTQVLEHIEDHEAVVDEFSRIIRPGGHALITVPRPPEPWDQPGHVREGYTEEELDALFEPRGFKRIHVDWFLTLSTLNKFGRFRKSPLHGQFIPLHLMGAELKLTAAERRADQPYGLLGLYRRE